MNCKRELKDKLNRDPDYRTTSEVLHEMIDSNVPTPNSIEDLGHAAILLIWSKPYDVVGLCICEPDNYMIVIADSRAFKKQRELTAKNINQLEQIFNDIKASIGIK